MEPDIAVHCSHCGSYQFPLIAVDAVVGEMLLHPFVVLRLGLDANKPDRNAADLFGRNRPDREPATPACAELDHREAPPCLSRGFHHGDPLEILLVHTRWSSGHMPSSKGVSRLLVRQVQRDPRPNAEEVHVPTGLGRADRKLELVEDRMVLRASRRLCRGTTSPRVFQVLDHPPRTLTGMRSAERNASQHSGMLS